MKMTFGQFQQEMIKHAKEVQGNNYVGDGYYLQDECWREHFDDGDSPAETVNEDMSYFEA